MKREEIGRVSYTPIYKSSIEPRKAEDAVAEQQNANAGDEAVLKVQDESTEVVIPDEVVIHGDEAVFKEEDAPIQFIITDQIDQRAESNAQEVEVTHHFITNIVYGVESELRHEHGLPKVIEYLKVRLCVVISVIAAERVRSDRKFRISPLEGVTERSNGSESVEPHHHVRGRIKDVLEVDKIAVPSQSIYGSVIATEGSVFGR